jgi:hypothetical protein
MRGIEAAQNMAQFSASLQHQQSGLRAAIEAGYMFSEPGFQNLSTDEMLAIQGMSAEDIAALSGPEMDVLTKKTGLSREDLVKRGLRMKTIKTLGPNVDLISKRDQLQKEIEGAGLTYEQALEDPRFRERLGEFSLAAGGRMLPAGTPQSERAAFAKQFFINPDKAIGDLSKYGPPAIGKPSEGRVADAVVADQARFDEIMNAMQKDFVPGIKEAANSSKELATAFKEAMEVFKAAKSEKDINTAAQNINSILSGMIPTVQPQAGPKGE